MHRIGESEMTYINDTYWTGVLMFKHITIPNFSEKTLHVWTAYEPGTIMSHSTFTHETIEGQVSCFGLLGTKIGGDRQEDRARGIFAMERCFGESFDGKKLLHDVDVARIEYYTDKEIYHADHNRNYHR